MNQIMENSDKNQFIDMLDTQLNRRLSDAEFTAFHTAYEEFIDMLHSLISQSRKSPLDLLHELARLQSRLMRLQKRIVEKEFPQALLLKSALLLTNFEIRLVFTRLRYPSITDPVSVEFPKSPLFLSEQFTPTDIMELTTALHLSGAIRRVDGTRVDLTTLVDVLSRTFNVRINNPEQCRNTLINRKLRLTHFLDILRNNLIAYSQR
ncbi:MAG: RteC domain-containing protein [Alistipes shahii]|uniref:RteC domain-containing protein n=1 Tax=Alistipes TaxID=239759 RepID=UPI001E4AEC30|nr:RteC domain-containing protein [Alistipes senegalensis]